MSTIYSKWTFFVLKIKKKCNIYIKMLTRNRKSVKISL